MFYMYPKSPVGAAAAFPLPRSLMALSPSPHPSVDHHRPSFMWRRIVVQFGAGGENCGEEEEDGKVCRGLATTEVFNQWVPTQKRVTQKNCIVKRPPSGENDCQLVTFPEQKCETLSTYTTVSKLT